MMRFMCTQSETRQIIGQRMATAVLGRAGGLRTAHDVLQSNDFYTKLHVVSDYLDAAPDHAKMVRSGYRKDFSLLLFAAAKLPEQAAPLVLHHSVAPLHRELLELTDNPSPSAVAFVVSCLRYAGCLPQQLGDFTPGVSDVMRVFHNLHTNGANDFTDLSAHPLVTQKLFEAQGFGSARFDRSALAGVSLTDRHIFNCSFVGTNLRDASFAWSRFRNVDFSGADLRGANFENTTWDGTTRFTGANLAGAKFTLMPHEDIADAVGVEHASGVYGRPCYR